VRASMEELIISIPDFELRSGIILKSFIASKNPSN